MTPTLPPRRQTVRRLDRPPDPRPHPAGIAMVAPAVRCVVVEVWWCPDGSGSTIHPVVAVVGWPRDGEPTFDALIVDHGLGGLIAASELGETDNVVYRIVPAPWDASEDDARLAGVVEELAIEAKTKAERNDRRAGRTT